MIDKFLRFENGNQIVKETISDLLLVMYLPKHEQLLQCPIKNRKKKQLMILLIKFSNVLTNYLCLSVDSS